jgi:hypothetical protein
MDKDIEAAQAQLLAEWNISEKYMKIAEQVGDKAVISSINELRYGGRKVLEAIAIEKTDKTRALAILSDALHDCYRARHDSIDASVSVINKHVNIMVRRLGYSKVAGVLPDLGELIISLSNAQEKIASSRSNRLERGLLYDSIKEIDLPAIRRSYDKLRASEPPIMAEAARERRNILINWTIGFLGLVISVVSLFLLL